MRKKTTKQIGDLIRLFQFTNSLRRTLFLHSNRPIVHATGSALLIALFSKQKKKRNLLTLILLNCLLTARALLKITQPWGEIRLSLKTKMQKKAAHIFKTKKRKQNLLRVWADVYF